MSYQAVFFVAFGVIFVAIGLVWLGRNLFQAIVTKRRLARSIRCSFCGKDRKQVQAMIDGPQVRICNECIYLCIEVMHEETASPSNE